MAKKIFMISPFDVLTGNLSGKQDLTYGKDSTKAYEAENGAQGAKDYRPRFIGARRADGKTYFSIRTKSTTVLNGLTRRSMALTASVAAIISVLKSNGTWASIKSGFDYAKDHDALPVGVTTLQKWVDMNLREMLMNHQDAWSFNQASIAFTVKNPYALALADALRIKQSLWEKFADVLIFNKHEGAQTTYGGFAYFIDGKRFVAPNVANGSQLWMNLPGNGVYDCPNYQTMVTGLSVEGGSPVLYNEHQIYLGSSVVAGSDAVVADGKYATVQA